MSTLVIGDVHGHVDRLEALLTQEGVLKDGRRVKKDVEVIQLGDLGHFGGSSGSPTGDELSYKYVLDDRWVDVLLWGNHDRAVVDGNHHFGGFVRPTHVINHLMNQLQAEHRLRICIARHGFFISHAGLHAQFKFQPGFKNIDKDDPIAVATEISRDFEHAQPKHHAIWDAIGRDRGGPSPFGGLLWRDYGEKLWRGFPQVFGHSASRDHLVRQDGDSWCIDIGGKGAREGDNCLAGIWLPAEEVVKVDLG